MAMLLEAIVYTLSVVPTPARFRRHLNGAIGLWARGRRQQRAWHGHLAETQRHILETAAALPRRRTLVVLGSGPLFDVPLKELGRAFERVILVDRVHLFTARQRASCQAN